MSEGSPIVFDHEQPINSSTLSRSTSLTSLSTVSESSHSTESCSSNSSTSNLPKRAADRAVAIQQVQQTWRVRREERDQRETAKRGGKPKALQTKQQQQQQQLQPLRKPPIFPSLCAVVQKTWTQAFDNKPKQKIRKEDRPKVFPSMLSIMQSNALVTQVRDLQDNDDDDDDDDCDDVEVTSRSSDSPRDQAPALTLTTPAASDPVVQSVLSILPAGYDWNTAILQMAQARSRAFLLLDLAAIVRKTVMWKRTYPNITWVHSVSSNANAKLLQVLLVAGVRLVTTSRADITHALNAMSKLKKSPKQAHRLVADSTSHVAPPDSYIRELLGAKVFSLAVDGASEVHRLVQTVHRMQSRHGQESPSLDLVLRLLDHHTCGADEASASTTTPSWMSVVESTLQAVQSYPQHRLAGISLDIGSNPESWKDRQDQAQQVVERILQASDSVKITLTGFLEQEMTFPDSWVQWWTRLQADPRVVEVAVECSYPLIASAGALCTRIIGVREQSNGQVGLKQSLYIDDGCYGSLYQTKGDLNPIPLGNNNIKKNEDDASSSYYYSSTVWGPTCDGLDRVCRDIPLPKLERDDWLVFPNLGCPGALGTAFNGFEPPDTAYCVLGYFK